MDADLIMLSLASPCNDMYVFREDSFRPDQIHIVDIGAIRADMRTRFEVDTRNTKVITDFVLLCYTVGNDFLPQIPGIEILQGGIDSLLHVYRDIREDSGYLATTWRGALRINKKNFTKYIESFSELEEDLINGKVQKKESFFPDQVLLGACSHNTQGKLVVDIELYKQRYYKKKFPEGISVEDICKEYLRGMQWVLNYYTTGIPSWRWCYPFDYAPFISDVVKYLPDYKWAGFPRDNPVLPYQQLMAVLPEKSNRFLPQPIAKLMTKDSELGDFFPEDFEVDISGKRKEWEGIIILPRVDIDRFKAAYDLVAPKIDQRDRRRNIVGRSFRYIRGTEYQPFRSYYGDLPENLCRRSPIEL